MEFQTQIYIVAGVFLIVGVIFLITILVLIYLTSRLWKKVYPSPNQRDFPMNIPHIQTGETLSKRGYSMYSANSLDRRHSYDNSNMNKSNYSLPNHKATNTPPIRENVDRNSMPVNQNYPRSSLYDELNRSNQNGFFSIPVNNHESKTFFNERSLNY